MFFLLDCFSQLSIASLSYLQPLLPLLRVIEFPQLPAQHVHPEVCVRRQRVLRVLQLQRKVLVNRNERLILVHLL